MLFPDPSSGSKSGSTVLIKGVPGDLYARHGV